MTPANYPFLLDTPAAYRIRVHGRVGAHWADSLGGLSIRVRRSRRSEPVTTLTGTLVDQASLMGVLTALYEMGFTLLDLKRLPDAPVLGEGEQQVSTWE